MLLDKVRHKLNINAGISQELFQTIYSSPDGMGLFIYMNWDSRLFFSVEINYIIDLFMAISEPVNAFLFCLCV